MPRIITPNKPPENVSAGAMDAVARLVQSGRQVYGSAGASLTWGIDGSEDGDVKAGMEGERMTSRVLQEWIVKHPAAMLINSVGWPGSKGDTDHILVVGNQVILIDSKRWKAKRKYSVTASGSIKRGTVAFPEGNVKIMPALNAWRGVLGKAIRVSGIVCVAQDEVFVPYDKEWYKAPYRLVTIENLPSFLDETIEKMEKANPGSTKVVGIGLLSTIVTRAIKPRDRRKEIINVKGVL